LKDPQVLSLTHISEGFCQQFELGWDGDFDCCDIRNSVAWDILLSGHKSYTTAHINDLIAETLQLYNETQPHFLWD
jgi:hypothetical protein